MYAERGIIAGCSFATILVKIFYMRKLDAMVEEVPRSVNIDAYIDDLALSAEGPRSKVAADIIKAHDIMRRVLTVELGCSLAQHKAAIVASDREVGRRIATALRNEEALTGTAVNLGMDITAGGHEEKDRPWLQAPCAVQEHPG